MKPQQSPSTAIGIAPAQKPAPTPLELAIAHQDAINAARDKIRADAGCINRLLCGRNATSRTKDGEFTIYECRLGLSGAVTVHGRPKGKAKGRLIDLGGVRDIKIVAPPDINLMDALKRKC